ncbi:MAG: Gfo/Idh/MocA family oxidoreductase [Rhodobacteraceae bacterium]|nr:Gfo/Idh/MocA family oxidoreductase [Paracoccaceae bacterium]MCY4139391.1 Gfo/Idh/MocA family oxidoreductase [Paracoccaceae bacterium]
MRSESRPVRLAIAGFGLAGQRHANAIRHVENVSLSAIADPDPESRRLAAGHGLTTFEEFEDMLEADIADGVVLSTPTRLHAAQGRACIECRCPVLIEKPLATDVGSARELVETAEHAQVALLVGHHRRFNPLISKAREMIAGGGIGEIRAAHATCWFYKPDRYFDVSPWRKLRGAGPVSVNLVHDIDLIRHLCGEITSVQAASVPSRRGFENEDVAAAILQFSNGAIGTMTVSDGIVAPWSWELTSSEYPIYPPTTESCYLIGGSHGSLSIPDLKIWSHPESRDWWSPISATTVTRDFSDPLTNQIEHFAAVIRGEEIPLVSGRDGLRALQVVDAIRRASRSSAEISLPVD